MNYKDITAVIVTFKSEQVIFKCLKSLKGINKIIIVDNSNDSNLKKKVLSKHPQINFILSKKNLGYAQGNNIALKKVKTKYVLILNPDTILLNKCIYYLKMLAKELKNNFSIIAPSVVGKNKNYGFFDIQKNLKKNEINNKNNLKVDYVKGFAMFFNLEKVKKLKFFDANFFMYLEEIDLCKRLCNANENIYVSQRALVEHIGAKSTSLGFDFEINRNWHWMWSKIYYSSKHEGFFFIRISIIPKIIKLVLKCILSFLICKKNIFLINLYRLGGLLSAYFNIKSFYRIKLS